MTATIPEKFHELLQSKAIAIVATLGKNGEPQSTPLWFMWDGEHVSFSLVEGRQKLKNLRRDGRISVVVSDPEKPTWYIELRGRVAEFVEDPDRDLERRIAVKYVGHDADIEAPGTIRYTTRVFDEKITSQAGV